MKNISDILNKKSDEVSVSENMLTQINEAIERNENMKKFNIKKTASICIALCAIFTVGVIGAGKVASISSHSSAGDEIKHFPSQEELDKYIDYNPKYIEKLGNYDFDFASPAKSSEKDDKGNTVHEYTDMTFWYKTDHGILTLNTNPLFTEPEYTQYNYEPIDYNGTTLYYLDILYKFVPPDYELTEEDKKLQKEKKLEISYGSQEIEYKETKSVSWSEDNIKYSVLDMDVKLSKEEIIEMAKQVIDSDNK